MSQSLSVILPVRNAEQKLADKVDDLLEVVADLSSELELIVVDDGSTDNTEEVAMELCRRFPQVEFLRRAEQSGQIEAVNAGIAKTTGEVVLIHDIESPLSAEAIRQFWAMRDDSDLVLARLEPAHAFRVPRMTSSDWSGTQMLRRAAVNDLQPRRERFADPMDCA